MAAPCAQLLRGPVRKSCSGRPFNTIVRSHWEHHGMPKRTASESIEWFIRAIRALPADDPVPRGTPGYNTYTTQKDHWLGWLEPAAGTGSYPRKTGSDRDARDVYNRIVEPKLLVWLISVAGVEADLIRRTNSEAEAASTLAGKSAAIRRHVPWRIIAEALKRRERASAT